jgi:hypothetical protein
MVLFSVNASPTAAILILKIIFKSVTYTTLQTKCVTNRDSDLRNFEKYSLGKKYM